MDADKKNKTSLDGDADISTLEMSVLEVSTSQDDTLNYQTADEENNSKYFSVIEGDSTLEGSSSADVTLDSKSDLNISAVAEKGPFDGTDKKPSQVMSSLSNLSIETVNKLQIHERIDAANILSGGVDIFDDNENSVDEHELVIDDDAHPSEKSNDCMENSTEVSGDTPYRSSTPGKVNENAETNFNKHFELFKKGEDVDIKNDSLPKCDMLVVVTKDGGDDKNGQGVTPKEMVEESQETDPKTDNYSALLQSNLPEGSSEVTLLIDDKNVDAIDIGEGVFIYKNDDGELTAIQITMNEDGSTNFKCLHVGKNEDGNLEVYEEQVNQVPVTNEELESMKAKELSKETDAVEITKNVEEVKTKEILVLDKTDNVECITLKCQNNAIKVCESKDEIIDVQTAVDLSEDLVINIESVSSVAEVVCDDKNKPDDYSESTIIEKLDNAGFVPKINVALASKLNENDAKITDTVKEDSKILIKEETKLDVQDSQAMVLSTEDESINKQILNNTLTIDVTDETKQQLDADSKNSHNLIDSTSPACSEFVVELSDSHSISNEDTSFPTDEKLPTDIDSDINARTDIADKVASEDIDLKLIDSCEINASPGLSVQDANKTLAKKTKHSDNLSEDIGVSHANISRDVSESLVNEKTYSTKHDKGLKTIANLTAKLDIVPVIDVCPKIDNLMKETSNEFGCSGTSENSLVCEDDSLSACKINKLIASSQSVPAKVNDDNINFFKSSETDSTHSILQESKINNVKIINEGSSELEVEEITVVSDITNENISELGEAVVKITPDATIELEIECAKAPGITNEGSSDPRLKEISVASDITNEDSSELSIEVTTLITDIANEDSSKSRAEVVTLVSDIPIEDSSEPRAEVVYDIPNEDSSEPKLDVVTITCNITNDDSSESKLDIETVATNITNEDGSDSIIDIVTVTPDITNEDSSEVIEGAITQLSDIKNEDASEFRIDIVTIEPNITNEDNSELRVEHDKTQSDIKNESCSGLRVECQESNEIEESEEIVAEDLQIIDEKVKIHVEELNVITEITPDCEVIESSTYEEISVVQSDVSPESAESSVVKESEKLLDTQRHIDSLQGEPFKPCENVAESNVKTDTNKPVENVTCFHNVICRVFNQKNILNANNDTEIVQSVSEVAINTEENVQITSATSDTTLDIMTNLSQFEKDDPFNKTSEKINKIVDDSNVIEIPALIESAKEPRTDSVNHSCAPNSPTSEKPLDNVDKPLKIIVIDESQNTCLEDNRNMIDTILETCNSPLKTLASQSSAESEDDLEEDDYVEGEPVTGDSGVEWIASNSAVPNIPDADIIVDTLGKNNSSADTIKELRLGSGSGVSNSSNDINDDVRDKKCIDDDKITNKKMTASYLEKQDLSDNNNDISAQGLSGKQTSEMKTVKGEEGSSAVTEVDFDKFVRRNSVPLFEECAIVDFEDVSETVKTMSVPVVEKEFEAEVVNRPLKQLPLNSLSDNGVKIISNIGIQPIQSESAVKKTALCEGMKNKPKLNRTSISPVPARSQILDNKNAHPLVDSNPASNPSDLKRINESKKGPILYKSDCVKMLTKHPESPSRPFANVSKLKTYSPIHKNIANMNSVQKRDQKTKLNEDRSLSPLPSATTSYGCSRVSPTSASKVSDMNNIGKIVSECKGQPIGANNEKTSIGSNSSKLPSDADTISSADESPTPETTPKAKSRHPRKQVFTPVTRSDMEIIFPNLYSNAEEYNKESEAKALKLNNKLKERDIRFKQLSKKDPPKSPVEKALKNCNAVSADTMSDTVKADLNISPSPKIDNETPAIIEVLPENGSIDKMEIVSPNNSVSSSPLSSSAKRKRGRPKKNQTMSSDMLKSDDDSSVKKYLPDKIQDLPQRQESPTKEMIRSDDSSQSNSISPFGKINDNIKCPICFKNFRTENVLLKHVKHCNGVIDIETIKSPRKRKITLNDSSKQDDEPLEPAEIKKQVLSEVNSSKLLSTPSKSPTESKKSVIPEVEIINVSQKEVIESSLSIKDTPQKNMNKNKKFNCSEITQQPECENKIELSNSVTISPEKKAKIFKNDEGNESLIVVEPKTTPSKTLLETITIEDSSSSSPPSPSNLAHENNANSLIEKNEFLKSHKILPTKCDSEENITERSMNRKESSRTLKEKMFGGGKKLPEKQQTVMASPMSRLTKIINTKSGVNNPIVCEICGKTFRQLAHMVYHRTKHAADESVPSEESEDNTKVNSLTKLNVAEELAENSVETDAMLKCEICQKGFRKLHHLVEHRELHINNESRSRRTSVASVKSESEAGFRCDTCDKSFRKLHHLVEHRELHIAEATESLPQPVDTKAVEDATCSGCGKSFRKRHHMVEHRDIHCSPSKKGKTDDNSSNDNNIRLSIASSTSEEGNSCGICGKSYRKLHHMVEHRESHTEVREEKNKNLPELLNTKDIIHECSRCYMVFPNENSLNKHITICSRKKLLNKSKSLQSENQEIVSLSDDATVSQSMPSVRPQVDIIEESDSVALGGSDKKCTTSDQLVTSVSEKKCTTSDQLVTSLSEKKCTTSDQLVTPVSESVSTADKVIALKLGNSEESGPSTEITPHIKESVAPSKDSTESNKRGRRSLFSKDNSLSKIQTPDKKSVVTKDSTPLKTQESLRKSNVPKNASTVGVIKNLRKSLTARSQDSLKIQENKTDSPKIGSYSLRRSTTSIDSATSKVTSSRRSTNSINSVDSKDPIPVSKSFSSKDKNASKLKIPLRKSLVSTVSANPKKAPSPKTTTNPAAVATKKTVTKFSPKKISQLGPKPKDDESTVKYMFNKNPEFKYKLNPVYNKPNRRLSQSLKPKATTSNIVKPRARTSESALSGLKLPTAKMLKTILEESTIRYSFPKSPDVKVKLSEKSDQSTPSTSQSTKKSITPKASNPQLKVNEKLQKNKKVISSSIITLKKKSIGGRTSVDGKKLPGVTKKLQLRCCGQIFSSQANLSVHRKTHKAVRQIHKCDCGKSFDSEGLLKRHIDTEHTPPKSYQCSECGTSVRTAAQFAKHKRDHETKINKPSTSHQSTVAKTSVVAKEQSKAGKAITAKQQSDPVKQTIASKKTPGKAKSPAVVAKKGVKRKIAHGGVPLSEKMRKAMAGVKF